MRKALSVLVVVLIIGIAWIYLFTGSPWFGRKFTPKNADVVSIDLLRGGKIRSIRNSNQCAEVLRTMSRAPQYQVAATPAFGYMILYFADGTTNQFFLSPAGRFSALEIANREEGYAISIGEMLGVFRKVGLLDGE